jgi:hypothetical protein
MAAYARAMPEVPKLLPTLIVEPDEPEVDQADIIEMALDAETTAWLRRHGLTFDDVLAGRVPWIDVEEILARAEQECADDGTMWSSCAR